MYTLRYSNSVIFIFLAIFSFACGTPPEDYIQLGKQKLQESKLEEAISFFDEALKIDPNLHDAWNAKGVAAFQLDKNSDALNAFNKAIELNSSDYRYFFNRGNVQRKLNSPKKAIDDYSKAISLDSSHYDIYLNRALSLTKAQQLPKALKDFDKAVELNNGTDPAVLLYRGKALLRAFAFQQALTDFQSLTSTNKKNSEAWYQLGLAYQGVGNQEAACNAIQEAQNLDYPQAKAFLKFYCKE